ncbi:MAG: DUF1641 domain-containing protein [candidate division KSB1 bacterium]|nr:DUF1641 domain-containing protein [candidate division KSB1 bacterium]MDZ7304318.1 DUF1641 domain-containing protein [candidate division KSB1 bacterium]MDZ7313594.1 DUF1641 domain-containing protein [candidate division KSB1 bacterium]
MNNAELEKRLNNIDRKLDLLTDWMVQHERRQREWQELKEDLNRIGADIFQAAVTELNEVSQHFDTKDLLYLLKKMLRNTRNLIKLMDQVESAADFFTDAAPIGKQAFLDLLDTLNALEQKGYFAFLKELFRIFDTIVTSFSVAEVKALGDNITTILVTVKNLTQPDMLAAVNNALAVYRNLDIKVDEKISYWDLLKSARTPEMKRGIAFGFQFLKNLSNPELLHHARK